MVFRWWRWCAVEVPSALAGVLTIAAVALVLSPRAIGAPVSAATAHATDRIGVYATGFERGAGAEWSVRRTAVTPRGARRFLGPLIERALVLTLTGLPPHSAVRVSADVYVLMSWDGNSDVFGPDVWEFGRFGRRPAVRTTFSNVRAFDQSYPGRFPLASYPALTGAAAVGTLGYPDLSVGGGVGDAVYRVTAQFHHASAGLRVLFRDRAVVDPVAHPERDDEAWGLDNVRVTVVE